jgi:hypothetical protein
MLTYVPLLIAVIAFPVLLHAIKRHKEVDEEGNPVLRLFGPALVLAFCGVVALLDAIGVIQLLRPPARSVDLAFAGVTFIVGAWFFFSKATLTNGAICLSMWPMSSTYSLDKIVSVDTFGKDSKKGTLGAVVKLSDGRKFGVLPFASGQKYFLEQLAIRIGERASA